MDIEKIADSVCEPSAVDTQKYEEFTEGKVKIGCIDSPTFYNPVQEFNRDLTICILRQFVKDRDVENETSYSNGDNVKQTEEPPQKKFKTAGRHSEPNGKIRIIDALSASGLRALRFAKEVPGVESVLANDFSGRFFCLLSSEDQMYKKLQMLRASGGGIKNNIKVNGVGHIVKASYGDAVDVLMSHRTYEKRFHAVDLDPYGSAAVFLDSAVQAVTDGGILM
uniref:tRNA (guanine(26)-N(2))-dimethyltransferase n=1 Tax=Ditylenchus dipsaci TaxID=166011 RepID=A0A915DDJ6_9BILA